MYLEPRRLWTLQIDDNIFRPPARAFVFYLLWVIPSFRMMSGRSSLRSIGCLIFRLCYSRCRYIIHHTTRYSWLSTTDPYMIRFFFLSKTPIRSRIIFPNLKTWLVGMNSAPTRRLSSRQQPEELSTFDVPTVENKAELQKRQIEECKRQKFAISLYEFECKDEIVFE